MKVKLKHILIILIPFLGLFQYCSSKKAADINNEKQNTLSNDSSNHENEYDIINQTIESIVDSLDYLIKLNLGLDYPKYTKIFIGDSLVDFGDLSRISGLLIDSIVLNKKGKLRMNLTNKRLKNGKEFKLVSSFKEYSDLISSDYTNRVLMTFSRVYLNKKNNQGVFRVGLSTYINSGTDHTVYVTKENNKWKIDRILETGIR